MTSSNRMLRTTALTGATAAIALFALTGCVGTESEPSPEPTATRTESSPSASASPSATALADDDPACLVGEWEMDQQGLTDFYDDVGSISSEAGMTFTPEGTAGLTIGASDYTWAPDLVLTLDAAGTLFAVDISGTVSGTYTASPGRITADATVVNDLVIEADMNGQAIDAASIAEQIVQAPLTEASFTCTEDTLVLVTSIADGTATATLTRR